MGRTGAPRSTGLAPREGRLRVVGSVAGVTGAQAASMGANREEGFLDESLAQQVPAEPVGG